MGEFSAHRVTIAPGEKIVIATHVNLYVSPYGDDVLNSGIEQGSPFRTPQRAFEWLGDKYISEFGFVTINFAGGIYDLTQQLVLDHDQGNRVALVGADVETLLLQYVSNYATTGFTASGFFKYYSGVKHGITLSCVRPDDNTLYSPITTANKLSSAYSSAGCGVVIEDYDLVYKDDYNPSYFYASYPFHPRNNLTKQASILGSHRLTGVTLGTLAIESSIRDDWFCIPSGSCAAWGRMYGNPQQGISYPAGSGYTADTTEIETNTWFIPAYTVGSSKRGHYLSNVPTGYYGLPLTTGIPNGATTNYMGATFPTGSTSGSTAGYVYVGITASGLAGWYTATGPAGTFLNDSVSFGKNYHEHTPINGSAGIGGSGSWKLVNSNKITVKIIPTVFRRAGNILTIQTGGLRKIKNIFFDGIAMPAHYNLLAPGAGTSTGYSNKAAIQSVASRLGQVMSNEPDYLGDGLCSNVGIKDFHVGFYANQGSDVDLGKVIASNCSFGILANNKSVIRTIGSVCTGMASCGFGSFNSSSMVVQRCFSAFSGQSVVSLRMKQAGATQDFADNSFIQGQTFATPDGKIRGTVWDWDSREKMLSIAVRVGALESGDPTTQQ